MMRWYHVFLLAFLGSLFIQTWIWKMDSFTDESLWLSRIEQLRSDLRDPAHLDATNPTYSGHPGMATVSLGALAREMGISPLESLQGSVILLNALTIAAAVVVSFCLRPQSLWWVSLAALLSTHPLYIRATPTNAVIGPLVVLATLLLIWLYERAQIRATAWAQILLATAIGVGLATRLETMGVMGAGILLLLSKKLGWKRILFIGMFALGVMVIVDPLWWFAPGKHLWFIVFRSGLNFTDLVPSNELTAYDFMIGTPLGLLSLGLACIFLLFPKRLDSLFPKPLLAGLVSLTVLFSVILLSVRTQSLRHFFPVILLWETLLPLFLLHLLALSRRQGWLRWSREFTYTVAQVSLVIFMIAGQSFLLWYTIVI